MSDLLDLLVSRQLKLSKSRICWFEGSSVNCNLKVTTGGQPN